MRLLLSVLVLCLGSACSPKPDRTASQVDRPIPEFELYQRALAYGTQIELNTLDPAIEKNLLTRLYRIPSQQNECFIETHGVCQYTYLLSLSSFDEQPEVKIFELPLSGEITQFHWQRHDTVDEVRFELSLSRYSQAALKNNTALENTLRRYLVTANLKTVTVSVIGAGNRESAHE